MPAMDLSKIECLHQLHYFVRSNVWAGNFEMMVKIVEKMFQLQQVPGMQWFMPLTVDFLLEWAMYEELEQFAADIHHH